MSHEPSPGRFRPRTAEACCRVERRRCLFKPRILSIFPSPSSRTFSFYLPLTHPDQARGDNLKPIMRVYQIGGQTSHHPAVFPQRCLNLLSDPVFLIPKYMSNTFRGAFPSPIGLPRPFAASCLRLSLDSAVRQWTPWTHSCAKLLFCLGSACR